MDSVKHILSDCSVLEMSLGCFSMTLKQNITATESKHNHHWGPGWFACKNQESKECSALVR